MGVVLHKSPKSKPTGAVLYRSPKSKPTQSYKSNAIPTAIPFTIHFRSGTVAVALFTFKPEGIKQIANILAAMPIVEDPLIADRKIC